MEITVYTAKFHGSEVVYRGKSETRAIRIARQQCGSRPDSDCGCGGAIIQKTETDGTLWQLYRWEATKHGKIVQDHFWAAV